VAFFEYEYEYRPPGRTEYEYEVRFWGCGPLTPDPSPPFHGGEGGIGGQTTCRMFVTREAAKPRKLEGGSVFDCGFAVVAFPSVCCDFSCSCSCSCPNFADSVAGWRLRSSGFPARALCWRFGICGRWLSRVLCPLTPDPSPPFHGGEGRNSGQWAVGLTRRREGKRTGGGCWRPSCRTPRHRCSRVALWLFRSSGFPARDLCW